MLPFGSKNGGLMRERKSQRAGATAYGGSVKGNSVCLANSDMCSNRGILRLVATLSGGALAREVLEELRRQR